MIFRLSQELADRFKLNTLAKLPANEDPLADWSARIFTTVRRQYLLICNTKSLYSILLEARGITNQKAFLAKSFEALQEAMRNEGQDLICQRLRAYDLATTQFARALDRSVTGSMNDMILMAKFCLTDDPASRLEAMALLNRTPFSKLAYANPRAALTATMNPSNNTEKQKTR